MKKTEEQARRVSDLVLDTVEGFLETCPELEGVPIEFLPRATGENRTVRMVRVLIDGEQYLVQCKRGG